MMSVYTHQNTTCATISEVVMPAFSGKWLGMFRKDGPDGPDLPTSLVAFIYLRGEEDLLDTLPDFRSRFESLTKT